MLLKNGVNVNVLGSMDNLQKGVYLNVTPLHLACYMGNYKMAKLLIDYGADTTICDSIDRNCFHYLASFYFEDMINNITAEEATVKQRIEIMPLLKCNINHKDNNGNTPFLQLLSNKSYIISKELCCEFIRYEADVYVKDKYNNTALMLCAKYNEISAALLLINYDNINLQNNEGDTALHIAIGNQNSEIAFILIDNKADLLITNNKGETPETLIENGYDNIVKDYYDNNYSLNIKQLNEIAERSFYKYGKPSLDGFTFSLYILNKMLKMIDEDDDEEVGYVINILYSSLIDDEECTVLESIYNAGIDFEMSVYYNSEITNIRDYCVSTFRSIEIIKKLSDLGVDMNSSLQKGITPASIIANMDESNSGFNAEYEDYYKETVAYFSKESMEELDYEGISAIHKAAKNNHVKMLQEMISKGIDVNICEDSPNIAGITPLHVACYYGKSESVELLLKSGADNSLKTANGETPAHYIVKEKERYISINEEDYEKTLNLLNDIDTPRSDGKTPIILLQELSNNVVCRLTPVLIRKGAKVNRVDNEGNTALTAHVYNNCDRDIIKLLLKSGADINARDDEGNTALHYALNSGNSDVARLLIKKGANYNIANNIGETPAEIATINGYDEVLELMTDIKIHGTSKNNESIDEYDDFTDNYEEDYGEDYEEDEEEENLSPFQVMVKAYSSIYGEENAIEISKYMIKISEMNEEGISEKNQKEYEQLISQYNNFMSSLNDNKFNS